ncbi:MAG: hypothetical protein ACRCXB_18790 [Aeromonadaceae bacterium]
MKISNSKKQLARIISENGGWRDGMSFSWYGNKTGKGYFAALQPRFDKASGSMTVYGVLGTDVVSFECEKVSNWHQTILSRDEYFHLYPAPDADGWIAWNGGECPVDGDSVIDVKLSDGDEFFGVDADWDWHQGSRCDIIAYRLHKPEQAKPEFCESVMRSITEPEAKPTIEQLAAEYRNAKDYAERKKEEADAAKADADAKMKALELAGEALGLLVSPITAKQEAELVITDWRDLQEGDVIRCVGNAWDDGFEGGEAVVTGIESHDYKYEHRIRACIGEESDWGADFHFIRRP